MRWSYKTTHFSMKKEGILGNAFLDEAEIEATLNEFGLAGWELVSLMEVNDGLIAVFKQPFSKNIAPVYETTHGDALQQSQNVTEMPGQTVQAAPPAPVAGSDTPPTDEDVGAIKIM